MAKARKILARTKAVKSIRTVTRTMEMVATARFKKAFNRSSAAHKYMVGMAGLVDDILDRCERRKLRHPLLRRPKKPFACTVVVLTSDRGLCGGYNSSILKLAEERLAALKAEGLSVRLMAVGKRGISQLEQAGHKVVEKFSDLDREGAGWQWASRRANEFMDDFVGERLDRVEIIYSQQIGAGGFAPACDQLLPLELKEPTADEDKTMEQRVPYEFVPSMEVMLERLLPMSVRLRLFKWFMEAAVTEQVARMSAMKLATENASDMIADLTVKYNRTRQAQITTELAEILGGRAALE